MQKESIIKLIDEYIELQKKHIESKENKFEQNRIEKQNFERSKLFENIKLEISQTLPFQKDKKSDIKTSNILSKLNLLLKQTQMLNKILKERKDKITKNIVKLKNGGTILNNYKKNIYTFNNSYR